VTRNAEWRVQDDAVFQNSDYPGHAPYSINIGAGTERWIAYSGGSVEDGLGQLSGRVHPPPEFAFAPGAAAVARCRQPAIRFDICRWSRSVVIPSVGQFPRLDQSSGARSCREVDGRFGCGLGRSCVRIGRMTYGKGALRRVA
jgi:hypothetical protein